MGAWGSGLYSGDFALDLRATIAALSRLPFDGERICEAACAAEPEAANNPASSDHAIFWLVLADQFQKRGILCRRATRQALALIDSGADTAMLTKLGMSDGDLRKRASRISELRGRLEDGPVTAQRRTLKRPQRLIADIGDVFVYPTSCGEAINPYSPIKEKGWFGRPQDAWAAMMIVDAGLAFGYLAWYTAMVAKHEFETKPNLAALAAAEWTLRSSGTLSPVHFKRMELEHVTRVALDRDVIEGKLAKLVPGSRAAISDVSIANRMKVVARGPERNAFLQKTMARAPSLEWREFVKPP